MIGPTGTMFLAPAAPPLAHGSYHLSLWWSLYQPVAEVIPTPKLDAWRRRPRSMEDAQGYIISPRSGLKVPLHDQQRGPFGTDSKDLVRDGFPEDRYPNPPDGDVWPF